MTTPALDVVHDRRHALGSSPDARESLAFILSLPAERIGVIAYTWVGGDGKAGSMLAVFGSGAGDEPIVEAVDGMDVGEGQSFDDWKVGAIKVRHLEPLRIAEVAFDGARVSLDYRFEAIHPAYNYGADTGGCPWYLADDRFEQSGTATGTLRVDDRTMSFRTTSHRDHSWGTRNWGAPQHWKWILAQTAPDVGVHVMETQSLGRPELRGYVVRDGLMASVVAVRDVDHTFGPGLMHQTYQAQIDDDAGRTTALHLQAHAAYKFGVSPLLTLNEVSMSGTIDDAPCAGHVEMAWTKEYLDRVSTDPEMVRHFATEERGGTP